MTVWLEATLLGNRFAFANGPRIEVMEPFPVPPRFSIGHRGSGATFECEVSHVREGRVEDGAVYFDEARVEPLQTHLLNGITGPALRVLRSPKDTCAWPVEKPAPIGRWDEAMLSVLGDSLLEAGYPVGALLHGSVSPGPWLSIERALPSRFLSLRWRRAVVDELQVKTIDSLPSGSMLSWQMGRSIGAHAVFKAMRALTIEAEAARAGDVLRFLAGLSASGLPCLERLEVQLRDGHVGLEATQREFLGMPGLRLGFPTLAAPVVRAR